LDNVEIKDYEFVDSYQGFQNDLQKLPQVVKTELKEKTELLKMNPFMKQPFRVNELRGRYKGKHEIHLIRNYRYVFSVNVHSHKIYSYEVRPRSQSYKQ
jgi:mRNA-degrading endonuclease RelE of RelBE toxin-antitoxin system